MSGDTYDLSPDKVRMFKSQSEDLSLIDAVKELVDNAIDNWTRTTNRNEPATVRISLDGSTTYVWDNTGGVPSDEIHALFAPGESRPPPEWSIGGYALGAKKAISRLGGLGEGTFDMAHVKSRAPGADTAYGYNIDRDWFTKDDWNVSRETFQELDEGCSEIVVGATEQLWDEESTSQLKQELGRTYVKFLTQAAMGQTAEFEIVLDDTQIEPADDVHWTYLPLDDLYPRRYTNIELNASYLSTPIQMQLEVGLMMESDPQEAGTDIYFQDRLVVKSSTSEAGGFGTEDGAIGRFTSKNERLKVKVELLTEGDASELPWDTQKKNIDRTSRVSSLMYSEIKSLVKPYFDADTDVVSDAIAMPYGEESEWAANGGSVRSVDVSSSRKPEAPRRHLPALTRLRERAGYHVTRGVYIDYEEYEADNGGVVAAEAVPAYTGLVFELANEELEPVSPDVGTQVIDDVDELRRTLGAIPYIERKAIDRILENNYISLDDLRDASVYQLQRINGVGEKTARRIKDKLEPKEGIQEILEELSAKPTTDSDEPDSDRVFDLYQSLLEFNSLPSQSDLDTVVDGEFPLLNNAGRYAEASHLYIPDDEQISEWFGDHDDLQFVQVPDYGHRDIDEGELNDLFERLGATRISDAVEHAVFRKGLDEVQERDSTPRERLQAAWESIENEFDRTFRVSTIECPSVIWVSETGVRYQLDDFTHEEPATCKYDPSENEIYLTPEFVVDWEALAEELSEAHGGSRETIATLLRDAATGLEDRAIDIIRQQESEAFRRIVDVRQTNRYDGTDVRGCDLLAVPYDEGEPRYIEVKARTSSKTAIDLIGHEPRKAEKMGKQYYLYVVVFDDRTDSVRLWRLSDPSSREYTTETVWRIKQSTWQNEGEEVVIR